MPPKKTIKKEPVKKEVLKKENFDHLKTEYDDLPCPIPYTSISYAENPELKKSRTDRLTRKDIESIGQAKIHFKKQELIALEKTDKELFEKKKKKLDRRERALSRLTAYKKKKRISFLTYSEYLALQAAGKLPTIYRIRLLRLHGKVGNLHYR